MIFIVKHNADGTFSHVFAANPGGIGDYDLRSPNDLIIPYDFDHSGKLDHLVLYRPGSGVIFIVKHNADGTFSRVFAANPGGIGGYDLRSPNDLIIPYDFDHSGKLDHLVLYRPGGGVIFIVKHDADGSFTRVYTANPGGIGGFDLQSPSDRIILYDFDHSGKTDYLALYRPGAGIVVIMRNQGGVFTPVYP